MRMSCEKIFNDLLPPCHLLIWCIAMTQMCMPSVKTFRDPLPCHLLIWCKAMVQILANSPDLAIHVYRRPSSWGRCYFVQIWSSAALMTLLHHSWWHCWLSRFGLAWPSVSLVPETLLGSCKSYLFFLIHCRICNFHHFFPVESATFNALSQVNL